MKLLQKLYLHNNLQEIKKKNKCSYNDDVDHCAATDLNMPSFLLLCLLYLRVSQWEGTPGEAAVRVTAGGGLPACRAGGTAGLITRAPETAGPPEAAEGGSGDAAGTPAHRGPERVQHERGRMTITQHTPRHPWLFSSPVCLEFRSVTHVILLPAMHPDDIWMKCKWFTLHYCTHARRKPFFSSVWRFLLLQKIWLAENWSRTCDTAKK